MTKFLLFTTGGASYDAMNTSSDEVALYNIVDLKSIKPTSKSTLDINFKVGEGVEVVTLIIKAGSHGVVMRSIAEAVNSDISIIKVADADTNTYLDRCIVGCSIKTSTPILYKSKIVNATQVNLIPINTKLKRITSMTLANIHSGAATATVFLSNSVDNWYIIKDVVIPVGSTLKLESDELDYDADIYNLYVKLGGSTPIDVIVR